MLSSWFTFLWPLIKEILASLKDSPELQNRDSGNGSTKAIIVLLFVAILAIGDMALDAHAELQKTKEELDSKKSIVRPATKEVELITQEKVELLLCQAREDTLKKDLTIAEDANTILNAALKKKCSSGLDKSTADRLNRLKKDD